VTPLLSVKLGPPALIKMGSKVSAFAEPILVVEGSKDGTDDGCCESEEGTSEGESDRLSDHAFVGASDDTAVCFILSHGIVGYCKAAVVDASNDGIDDGCCESEEGTSEGESDRLSDDKVVGASDDTDGA